jgi:hypothetical protein
MEASMKEWKTEMWLSNTEGHIKTRKVAIKQRIVQDDSSSPLLFCLVLIPLTNTLGKQGAGYAVKGENKVSNLFYMDDLKLFSRDETDLTAGVYHCHNILRQHMDGVT